MNSPSPSKPQTPPSRSPITLTAMGSYAFSLSSPSLLCCSLPPPDLPSTSRLIWARLKLNPISLSPFARPNPTRSPRIRCSASMASGSAAATTRNKKGLLVFESEEDLAAALAKYTANLSGKFTAERGAFTVVISGGSLVKALRKLVEAPFANSIEWGKWHVFWVDERVVPKDHEDSNYKQAYDGFLSKVPIPPGHVYAINDALPAEGAADDYETCLKQLVKTGVLQPVASGFPKFDLMLLGMGPDGHVASLFPGHPLLNEKGHWITFIKDSPKPPPERITFTFPVINSSANIALVATGSSKAGVVQQALGGENSSSSELLPVQMITLEDGELTWFADKAAASKL